jgi:branched-chain amino acid transport system ATP-binding protein
MTAALETVGLGRSFRGFHAVKDVTLALARGARHAIIGPNGAGKTTLINLITGTLWPSQGRVLLDGRDVTGLSSAARARLGLGRTFQINQLFADLTPLQSMALAVAEREGLTWRYWHRLESMPGILEEAAERLRRLQLADVQGERTEILPYGRQRLLEVGLALALQPRLLLLDEPAAGIPAEESGPLLAAIAALPPEVTVLLIEHDMDLVFRFAQRITVLVEGRVLVEGPPDEIARDARVREVYLGSAAYA